MAVRGLFIALLSVAIAACATTPPAPPPEAVPIVAEPPVNQNWRRVALAEAGYEPQVLIRIVFHRLRCVYLDFAHLLRLRRGRRSRRGLIGRIALHFPVPARGQGQAKHQEAS
jgi:hypothetical protein